MKSNLDKQFDRFGLLVSLLCVLCASVVNSLAQDFKTVYDGVEYAEVTRDIAGLPVKMNLLRLDLIKVRLDVHHAMDAAIGTEKTSSIATRHGAVAAINAGFFRLDTSIWAGDSAGALRIDGLPWSDSGVHNRIALLINNGPKETRVGFSHLTDLFWVRFDSWSQMKASKFPIVGMNRERKETDFVWYNDRFGKTTLTGPGGTEIVVQDGRVKAIYEGKGSSEIPKDGYVFSLKNETVEWRNRIRRFARIGSRVTITLNEIIFDPQKWTAEDITNGVPQLIKDGKIDITWEQEKSSKSFVETRHPRTAVAKLKDGKFLMITVDGRQPGVSVGMNLNELAEYLLGLGAVDAMNLDGGGSTTMFLDGKVVNKPSDKEGERKVGDAILVTLRKKK